MTAPKHEWHQVTDPMFRPDDEIWERDDDLYRVLCRVGAPGWNLLARDLAIPIGWNLIREGEITRRRAQEGAAIHEHARAEVAKLPPLGEHAVDDIIRLMNGDPWRPGQ